MNLPFKEFNEVKNTLVKLTKSNVIDNWDDILIISELEAPIAEAQRLFGKAFNVISFKYGKKAEVAKRITKELPQGFNTIEELEKKQAEEEKLEKTICTVNFDFKKITKETVELLLEKVEQIITVDGKAVKTGRKTSILTPSDISVLRRLKLIKGIK